MFQCATVFFVFTNILIYFYIVRIQYAFYILSIYKQADVYIKCRNISTLRQKLGVNTRYFIHIIGVIRKKTTLQYLASV